MDLVKFDEKLKAFLIGAQALVTNNLARNGYNWTETIHLAGGTKYIRVACKVDAGGSTRVWAFVNKENGDVLKPAGWKAPAKHARGNIFDSTNGLGSCNWHGPEYLK